MRMILIFWLKIKRRARKNSKSSKILLKRKSQREISSTLIKKDHSLKNLVSREIELKTTTILVKKMLTTSKRKLAMINMPKDHSRETNISRSPSRMMNDSQVLLFETTSWRMTLMISLVLLKIKKLLIKICQNVFKSDSKIEFNRLKIN